MSARTPPYGRDIDPLPVELEHVRLDNATGKGKDFAFRHTAYYPRSIKGKPSR
ncbi:MAG: hypothetical protein V3S95_08460 [Alphaproteobacteria bacterium]|jgi:hypothetical protein